MVKPLRIILVIVIFIAFFEVGLISSYTIVTTEVPDIKGLIEIQIEKILSFFSPSSVNKVLIKDPTNISISNKEDVSLQIQTISDVDGIDLDSINVTTYEDTSNKKFNVTIECFGFADPQTNSSQIIISQTPSYKIIATAEVKLAGGEYKVIKDSIQIQSILKLYNK